MVTISGNLSVEEIAGIPGLEFSLDFGLGFRFLVFLWYWMWQEVFLYPEAYDVYLHLSSLFGR